MKIVIDIPEIAYEGCKAIKEVTIQSRLQKSLNDILLDAVANGTVLPEPQTQWIPVSEKPSKNGGYLCSARFNDNYIGVCIANYADDLYKVDDFDFHDKKGISGWYDYDSEYGYYEMESVIAWMPLPKPYREDDDNER